MELTDIHDIDRLIVLALSDAELVNVATVSRYFNSLLDDRFWHMKIERLIGVTIEGVEKPREQYVKLVASPLIPFKKYSYLSWCIEKKQNRAFRALYKLFNESNDHNCPLYSMTIYHRNDELSDLLYPLLKTVDRSYAIDVMSLAIASDNIKALEIWLEREELDEHSINHLLGYAIARLKGDVAKVLLRRYNVKIAIDRLFNRHSPYGMVKEIELMIDIGMDVISHPYLLIESVRSGFIDAVTLLLDNGVDIHHNKDEALYRACCSGSIDLVNLLLSREAEIAASDYRSFVAAARFGNIEIVRHLMSLTVDRGGGTGPKGHNLRRLIKARDYGAFRAAAAKGYVTIVRLLVETGLVDIDAVRGYALRYAAKNDHRDVVRYLLKCGAKTHLQNYAALKNASRRGHSEIVAMLLDYRVESYEEYEALKFAVAGGYRDVVTVFCEMSEEWSNYIEEKADKLCRIAEKNGYDHLALQFRKISRQRRQPY